MPKHLVRPFTEGKESRTLLAKRWRQRIRDFFKLANSILAEALFGRAASITSNRRWGSYGPSFGLEGGETYSAFVWFPDTVIH
jgi:hypothetical protein